MKIDTTIVVLTYNALDVTKKFIEHLFKNTKNFNLIMIDNGSIDSTQQYLDEVFTAHDRSSAENHAITFVKNDANLGVIGGRNQGFALYQNNPTDYLCFLDNDQFVADGWLEQYHNFMRFNFADIIGCDAWLMNANFMPTHNCKRRGEPYTYVGCGGMMIRRKVLEDIGLFDEQFNPAYFEDPDFNFRARKNNYKILWNCDARITHLPHQTLGKNKDRMQIFNASYGKFKTKWAGNVFLPLR